jgi:hypothetical protein
MAGQSRTLKLSILGDVDQLNKSLKAANNDVENSSSKIGDFGKKAGLAFAAAGAAAGAYAIKIGIDGVKAALEDEKAQRILALTLENTTKATVGQIEAVEKYITKTSLAVGVTDDQLRPAFSRLVRSTKDVEEAQKLLNLALDISSATGKPLEAISNSLGKAYDGNTNALGKLGLGIDQNILKTKDFNLVYETLRSSFKGFAEGEAQTFQGRLDRLKVAFDETKETIGFALLPVLQKFLDLVTTFILPVVNRFSDAISSNSPGGLGTRIMETVAMVQSFAAPIFEGLAKLFGKVKDAITENSDAFKSFFEVVKVIAPVIGKIIGGALSVIGDIAGVVIDVFAKVLSFIKPILDVAIDGVNAVIRGINLIKPGADIPSIKGIQTTPQKFSSISGVLGNVEPKITVQEIPKIVEPKITVQEIPKIVVPVTPKISVPEAVLSGSFASDNTASFGESTPGVSMYVTVNQGIVGDPEASARAVIDVVNRSFFRGTGGASAFVTV